MSIRQYEGHGIIVTQEGHYSPMIEHDLDDVDLAQCRADALQEIDAMLSAAAPGAKRIARLTSARGLIVGLKTAAEVAGAEEEKKRKTLEDGMEQAEELRAKVREEGPGCLVDGRGKHSYYLQVAVQAGADVSDLVDLAAVRGKEVQAEKKREDAENEREGVAREAEKAAEAKRQGDEVAEWIRAHGSTRLRRILEEGIDCRRTYRDERLAVEAPGWVWYSCICGEPEVIWGASMTDKALDELDRQRLAGMGLDIRLAWMGQGGHLSDCDCERDDCGEKTVKGRPILEAEFMDRTIVHEIPA